MQPYAWEFVEESLPVTKMAEDGIMCQGFPSISSRQAYREFRLETTPVEFSQ
jgi:hypothetical protein